ncbi:MAG: POTRA domain-containing protein [Bryobacteraceae bacterium]
MRLIVPALLLVLAGSIGAQQTLPLTIGEALKYEGLPIVSIAWEPADQPLTAAQLAGKLPFHPGSVFHERQLREAIQNLFSTGRFSDLAVDAEAEPSGVALKFITKRAYFVGHVAIYGIKAPPSSGEAASALKLRLGLPFVSGDEHAAIAALSRVLRRNGFYHAEIAAELHYEPKTETANLVFDVDTGERARFARPAIGGIPQSDAARVIGVTHWKRLYGLLGWEPVTQQRLREGIENIRTYYQKRNRLESSVTLAGLSYLPKTNRVRPVVSIHPGPRIAVRETGAKIGRSTLEQLVPVFQEHSIDKDLLAEGSHNIEQYLQAQGYLEAKAAYSVDAGTEGQRIVTYRIVRGPKHKFVHLAIAGNHYFTPETISERLSIQPAEFPRYPYGRFSGAYLRHDVESIASLYRANGFRGVKVTSKVEDDYRGVKNHLGVVIRIEEGPQSLVSKLAIEGARPPDLPALRGILASGPGQPFSDESVAEDRDRLLNFYYNRGYLNATFAYYISPAGNPARVNLRYVLHTGPQKTVRNVLVSGLATTRASVVYDRIELKKGQPLSLAEQTDSQRRLYDLGVFARVNTAIQNPDGGENQKDVLYDIDEAHHYALDFGVGAQIARIGGSVTSLDNPAGTTGFAPRVSLGLSRLNFLGLAQTLGVQTSLSTIEQRAALTYFIPQFVYHDNLNLTGTVLVENSNDIRTFTANRREASVQLGQTISRALTLQYRLVFRNVTLGNIKINQLLVPLLSQPETVGLG